MNANKVEDIWPVLPTYHGGLFDGMTAPPLLYLELFCDERGEVLSKHFYFYFIVLFCGFCFGEMITSLTWVPKGAARSRPVRFELSKEEYARIKNLAK
jgi:hypothetical protein